MTALPRRRAGRRHVDLTPGAARPVRLVAFGGTLEYRGLTVEYFKPLSPLRGVDGTASFDRKSMELRPRAGASSGFKFRPAR